MGSGLREQDSCPYRAMGPVTEEEYKSREERYDRQLSTLVGVDPERMTLQQKMTALRGYREEQYQKLVDAVYKRRGWTAKGVPTLETLKRLKVDFPEVVEVVKPHLR
jgi:aldehyde:ferredoxin oxidoreductase